VANQAPSDQTCCRPRSIAGEATTALISEAFAGDPSLLPEPPSHRNLSLAAALAHNRESARQGKKWPVEQ